MKGTAGAAFLSTSFKDKWHFSRKNVLANIPQSPLFLNENARSA